MTTQARSVPDRRDAQQGVALLITVLILFVVSLLGATVVSLGQTDLTLSANYSTSVISLNLADAGLAAIDADLRTGYGLNPADNWLDDWVDSSVSPPVLVDPFPDPADTTINGLSLTPVSMSPNPYPGTPYEIGAEAALGTGTYRRIIWLPPAIVNDGGTYCMVATVRSIGKEGGPMPSESTIDALVNVDLLGDGTAGAAMFLGDGDGGDVISGNRLKIAGSVVVAGDGDTRFHLRSRSSIVNNYSGISDNSRGLGVLATKLPALDQVDYNGETIESLNSVVRIQEADVNMGGQTSMGEPDLPGDMEKEFLDAIYSNDLPNNADLYADTIGPTSGDDLTFPSLYAPYTDPDSGGQYASFEDFLNSVAYVPGAISGDLIIDKDTGSFSYTDPGGKGHISWNPATETLTIDGVIKVNGQVKLGDGGEIDDDDDDGAVSKIKYKGTGAIWSTDKIEIKRDIYPAGLYLEDGPDIDGLVDGNLGLIASKEIEIQSGDDDPNVRIIAALFAEEKILVKEPANIAGAVATNYFESSGNDRVNVWQVPRLQNIAAFGMQSAAVTGIDIAITDWYHDRR